ncbi:hypothetical protein B0H14DRAFT_2998732, partial [Mycena olivaceomarginata]
HSYPTRELLFQAAVNQVATDSASNTRTAVSSSGPLRDVKRAERIVARTLRIRLRGVTCHFFSQWGQSASRRRARGQRPRARAGRMQVRRSRGQGVQWATRRGIAVGWVVVLVLLASALAAGVVVGVHGRLQRSHLVLELAYARGAVPDAVAHGDAVGSEPVGALDEGGDGVRVGDAGGRGKCTYLPGHRQDLR